MVDEGDDVESQGGMAGLAHITAGDVITCFTAYSDKTVVMTTHAT